MSGGAAPARYVSVSELYSADEVELLLEEIRELEPTSCRGEELADFEIAGSGAARSPAPTERSWDSHAHYGRAPRPPPARTVPLYCRMAYLAELHALLTLLIVVCSVCAASCVWAVTGLRGRLPLDGRARLLALAGLSSTLLHSALFLAHLTRITHILPLNWDKLAMWTSLWSGLSLLCGGAGTLLAVLFAPQYRWTPEHIAHLLYSASGLALSGACASFIIAGRVLHSCVSAGRADALRTRAPSRASSASTGRGARAAYRAVPAAPPPAHPAQPSTSRQNNL